MQTPRSTFPNPTSRLLPPSADRLLVVLSDIEMGAGGPTDDFPHSAWLGELLLTYNEPPYHRIPVELVFNGDTFDLLKTSFEGAYPRHVTAAIALHKLARIAAAHRPFFEAVRRFLEHRDAERRVHFVIGNHDLELLFPEVQRELRRLLGDDPRVSLAGMELHVGDVHIEHGQQADPSFRMEEPWFVDYQGERILNLPWASVALLDVAMPMHPILHHHDRIKPREELFALLPDVREAVVNAYWTYWTRDWARSAWRRDDPVKRVSWTVLREVAYRFRTQDGDVRVRREFERRLQGPDAPRVIVVGHEHRPALSTWGDRRFLVTGAFRDEYMLEQAGRVLRPIQKTWAEVFLEKGHAIRARLVDIDGPPAPEGYAPESIFNVLEPVKAHLLARSEAERKKLADAQQEQEAREADDGE